MARAIPGFPADAVREGLRIPMRMGLPVDETQWPEFVIVTPPATSAGTDDNGYPWDPTAPVVRLPEQRLRVLCAITPSDPDEDIETFGPVQPGTLVITLLDEEYRLVEGFQYVNLWLTAGGPPTRFYYRNVRLRSALDTVEVWQIEVASEDVS